MFDLLNPGDVCSFSNDSVLLGVSPQIFRSWSSRSRLVSFQSLIMIPFFSSLKVFDSEHRFMPACKRERCSSIRQGGPTPGTFQAWRRASYGVSKGTSSIVIDHLRLTTVHTLDNMRLSKPAAWYVSVRASASQAVERQQRRCPGILDRRTPAHLAHVSPAGLWPRGAHQGLYDQALAFLERVLSAIRPQPTKGAQTRSPNPGLWPPAFPDRGRPGTSRW